MSRLTVTPARNACKCRRATAYTLHSAEPAQWFACAGKYPAVAILMRLPNSQSGIVSSANTPMIKVKMPNGNA